MSAFRDAAQELLDKSKYEAMRILVWGPGDPGASGSDEARKLYNKRLQIRDVLREQFPRSEVFFSEDPEMMEVGLPPMSQLQRETLQAAVAHLVIILALSRGSEVELDYLVPNYPWFRDKVYALLPERYASSRGLARGVLNFLTDEQVIGFSQAEFDECKVATVKAVHAAQTVAVMKLLAGPQ